MSENRRLTRADNLAAPKPDVVDAEFVEIDEPAAVSQRHPTIAERWYRTRFWIKLAAFLVPLFLLVRCLAGPVSEPVAATSNNADEALAQQDDASAADPMATDAGTVEPQAEPDGSELQRLLAANDAAACNDPVSVLTIRGQLLPDTESAGGYGLSNAERRRALDLARVELTEVSASGIRPDIHEISCDANLRYGDGPSDAIAISYGIRPSADPSGAPIYYIKTSPLAPLLIMRDPVAQVKSERPRPQRDDKLPTEAPADSETNDPRNTASDDALFAPHG